MRVQSRSGPSRRQQRRSGFTLLELALVLAVLVLLAAIVAPSLEKPFANERLRKAADQMRGEWTRARVKAMSSGVPQVFRCQLGGGQYRLETWGGLEVETEAADLTAFTLPQEVPAGSLPPGGRELPEGVAFAADRAAADSRSLASGVSAPSNNLNSSNSAAPTASQDGWSTPVFFYPDGTTSTAELILQNENQFFVRVTLRGLTGVVVLSDVLAANELGP